MASKAHQFILELVARKMRSMGYEPVAYDGDSFQIGRVKLNLPPTIRNHKPDIVGINTLSKFCIGEAKTQNDIFSDRSKKQFVDFSKQGELIIGSPKSAEHGLHSQLKRLGLLFNRNVSLLAVPDELIPNDEENI